MFDQVYHLAAAVTLPTEGERPLLEALCASAQEELIRRLRPGLTPEDCGDTFLCAAAMLAAAGLMPCREGDAVEQFSAGDVSLRTGNEGACAAAASLRRHAAEMMAPYWADDDFAFAGVKG